MRIFAAVVLSLVLAAHDRAQVPGGFASKYPLRAVSPSGEWVLTVEATNQFGWGAAACRVERNGELAWEAQLPFTFTEAGVTDGGITAGIVAHLGIPRRDTVFAVIDETGVFRLREVIGREPVVGSPACLVVAVDSPPTPSRMLLDAANDRVLFRPKVKWLAHRLSDGVRTHELDPLAFAPREFERDSLEERAWRAVPDTGLVLAEWSCSQGSIIERSAWFALFGSDLRLVWSWVVPGARRVLEGEQSLRLAGQFKAAGTQLVDVGPEGAFRLALVETRERVAFRALRDARATDGWRVDEIGREALAAPVDERAQGRERLAQLPEHVLVLLERAPLHSESGEGGTDSVAALPGVLGSATVDMLDRLLVCDRRTKAIHGFDASGLQVLVAQPAPEDLEVLVPAILDALPSVAPSGDLYVLWRARTEGSSSFDFRRLHFAADGRRIGLEPTLADPADARSFPAGAGRRWWVGRSLHWVDDATGERRHFERGPDARWLGVTSERKVAVAADGSLAFLSQTRDERGEQVECVHLFSGDGKPLRTVHLDARGYFTFSMLYTGERLLFPSSGQWVALDLAGEPIARYALAEFPDGIGPRDAFIAARGRELWVFARPERELWRFALP